MNQRTERGRAFAGPDLGAAVQACAPYLLSGFGSERLTEVELGAPFAGVVFSESGEMRGSWAGRLVLCPGLEWERAGHVLTRAAAEGAAAVVLRDQGEAEAQANPAASGHQERELTPRNLALLSLSPEGDWAQLANVLRSLLATAVPDALRVSRMGDLFAAANAVASKLGGAVSFVDPTGRVLGYSTHSDQPIDQTRRVSTLSLQESASPATDPDHRSVLQAHGAIARPAAHPGEYARVAAAVRWAGELLGSVWVVQADPRGSAATIQGLNAFIPLISQHFANARENAAEHDRRITEHVHALLGLRGGGKRAASVLGIPASSRHSVLCFAVDESRDSGPVSDADRLLRLVLSTSSASFAYAQSAVAAGRVYTVVSSATSAAVDRFVAAVCDSGLALVGGVGSEASSLAQIPGAGREADCVVSAILSGRSGPWVGGTPGSELGPGAGTPGAEARSARRVHHGRWGRFAAVRDRAAVVALADTVAETPLAQGDAWSRVLVHDTEREPALGPTLLAYLRAGGNVRQCAQALHVHQNTVRYRLSVLRDELGVDLEDPDARLWLWLRAETDLEGAGG